MFINKYQRRLYYLYLLSFIFINKYKYQRRFSTPDTLAQSVGRPRLWAAPAERNRQASSRCRCSTRAAQQQTRYVLNMFPDFPYLMKHNDLPRQARDTQ
eukprot:COSAG06_NODE_49914_length_322_cov_0.699552_1_plen_98_part_10